jgi:hypothetical protein
MPAGAERVFGQTPSDAILSRRSQAKAPMADVFAKIEARARFDPIH